MNAKRIHTIRRRIFEIIEAADKNDSLSKVYDIFMIILVVVSIYPMTIRYESDTVFFMEEIVAVFFVIDYLLRWMTADFKLKKAEFSFLIYPFTLMAIFDFLSILPALNMASGAFRITKSFRLIRALRVIRAVRLFRYSKNIDTIVRVVHRQRDSLIAVCIMAVGYIILSACLVFSVEPATFPSFFDALYWATVSLTTVGYGDITTVSVIGKSVTMVSQLFGVAVVALPAGIITAGFTEEIRRAKSEKEEDMD